MKLEDEILSEARKAFIKMQQEKGFAETDKYIKSVLEQSKFSPSDKSIEQYRKLVNNKSNANKSPMAILFSCRSKGSFDKSRSAIKFAFFNTIKTQRKNNEAFYKKASKETNEGVKKELEKKARQASFYAFASAYYLDKYLIKEENKITFEDVQAMPDFKKARMSKRKTVKKAPSYEDILNKMTPRMRNRHGLNLGFICLFGCRPAEVDGAKMYIKDNKLFAEIKGVKVGKDRGQEKRIVGVELDNSNKAHRLFKAILKSNNNEVILKMNNADYSSLKKFFHRNYKDISLYTYRHKMGADLKGGGYNKVEIAKILGHRNTRSQTYYGYRHHHSSIGGLDVEASNDVKVVNNFKDGLDKKARQNDFANRLKKAKGGFSNPNIISRPKFTPPGKK